MKRLPQPTGLTAPDKFAPGIDITPLPLMLHASRVKASLLLAVCLAFTVIGVWMGIDTHDWIGWACAALFGLGCVVFTLNMLPNASFLRLEEDGFTYSALYRRHTVKWAVTRDFGVMAMRYTRMVGWSFVANHRMSATMRKLNQAIAGFDAALPDTYGMRAETLAVLMATLRDRYWMQHGLSESDIQGEGVPQSDNAAWAGR